MRLDPYSFTKNEDEPTTTTQDIADEDTEMDRKIHHAKKVAELRQVQAKGMVGVAKSAYQAATIANKETPAADAVSAAPAPLPEQEVVLNGNGNGNHRDTASFQ